jgi:glutathione S-transferase
MSDDKLILYGEARLTSPYVFSCHVALREKGLPFEFRLLSLQDREHHRPEYRDRSLTGRVPALQHGDFWLSESSAIDEYLEEAFPPPRYPRLYPEALRDRARARQIQAWLRSDLLPIREERPTASFFYREPVKPFTAAAQTSAERLIRIADMLVAEGATSIFGAFTIADVDLALMLYRLIANGDPVPGKLSNYAAAQWRRPSVREFVEHARPPHHT